MNQLKQPGTLFDIALPATATVIRSYCDAILENYNDVTQQPFKDHIESLNNYYVKEVPRDVLEPIRLEQNLAKFIYFDAPTLNIKEDDPQNETLKDTPTYNHFVVNMCPKLENVKTLDLTKVEGTFELFKAIGENCHQLEKILVDTNVGSTLWENLGDWGIALLPLGNCKNLTVLEDLSTSNFYPIDPRHIALILQKMPQLKVFNCDRMAAALALPHMRTGVYQLTRLDASYGFSAHGEEIHWLNAHCPHLTVLNWHVYRNDTCDSVLRALTTSNLKISSLTFPKGIPLSLFRDDTMKMYLMEKGKYLHRLELDFGNDPLIVTSLTLENILTISQCCPGLKRLTLQGRWHNEGELSLTGHRTTGLFPSLEYFRFDCYSKSLIYAFILEQLLGLKTLSCCIYPDILSDFLDIFAFMRNQMISATSIQVEIRKYVIGNELSFFLQRLFYEVAMVMPSSKDIFVKLTYSSLTNEAADYVTAVKHKLKKSNLDINLVVESKIMDNY